MTRPGEVSGVVEAITAAREASAPLEIAGNGTKNLLRPVQAAATLSTAGLAGITLYSPAELIISARAGTPMAEISAAVAEHGQHLIAEPPDLSALFGRSGQQTLGGVVATNLSGPRRIAWGAMRDHVMGVQAVNGLGEVIRSGGRVLKNVTGLDLCKLLTGSHGTLAVLTEITLKVLPAPERSATLVLKGLAPERAVAMLAAALGSPYAVSGAAYLPQPIAARVPSLAWMDASVTLARIEDFANSVTYRAGRLRSDLAAFGAAELLDDGASKAAWAAVRDVLPLAVRQADAEPPAVWRVSVRPSAGVAVARAIEAAGAAWFMDWGGGLLWVEGPANEAMHELVEATARTAGGVWTLVRAADALRSAVHVVPPEAAALARITKRVKAAFDPDGILNPGRIYAGI